MIHLDGTLPAELVPLSWLIGVWEGSGLISYAVGDDTREHEFGQRVSFSHDGGPYLNYSAHAWLVSDPESTPFAAETGYWRLSRQQGDGDAGPGMLPPTAPSRFATADDVESLRNNSGGFDLEVSILHPNGVSELYLGQVAQARIDLATDAVMRAATAKEHAASTRLYGLVDEHLLWAWDIAALGHGLRTHASGRLGRLE